MRFDGALEYVIKQEKAERRRYVDHPSWKTYGQEIKEYPAKAPLQFHKKLK